MFSKSAFLLFPRTGNQDNIELRSKSLQPPTVAIYSRGQRVASINGFEMVYDKNGIELIDFICLVGIIAETLTSPIKRVRLTQS